MRHAWHVRLVGEIAHIDIKTCTGLVRLRIVNEQCFQLVGELDDSVGSIVEIWFLQVVRYVSDGAHDCCKASAGQSLLSRTVRHQKSRRWAGTVGHGGESAKREQGRRCQTGEKSHIEGAQAARNASVVGQGRVK